MTYVLNILNVKNLLFLCLDISFKTFTIFLSMLLSYVNYTKSYLVFIVLILNFI